MRETVFTSKSFYMKASLKLVTIKGISVYLHFTFLLFLVWVVFLFAASGMLWWQLFWSVIFLLGLFTSIVMHEYAHALVAAIFGITAKRITLYPIGGIASIEKLPENPRQELLISGAGPVFSFCLGALLLLFSGRDFSMQSLNEYSGVIDKNNIIYTLGVINIVLAVFNLIPAFPMDGGRILRALLAMEYNYIKATTIAAFIGKVIAGLIIILAIFTFNFILALIGVFIILFASAEESFIKVRNLVKDLRLRDVLMYDYTNIDSHLTIAEAAPLLEYNHNKYFVAMDHRTPVGVLNRVDVMKAVAEQDYERAVSSLMKKHLIHFEIDMPVENVLDKISGHEDRIYPVFDKERFVGVVSFEHIIEYVLLHKTYTKQFVTKRVAELV
jgi:Zn-dependent protease/predicted transcriptional regulator